MPDSEKEDLDEGANQQATEAVKQGDGRKHFDVDLTEQVKNRAQDRRSTGGIAQRCIEHLSVKGRRSGRRQFNMLHSGIEISD